MREIQAFLLEDEKILWRHVEIKNLLKLPLLEVLIGITLACLLSIFFNVIFYLLLQETLILFLSLIIFPITKFMIFGISLIIPGIKKYLEILNNLKIPPKMAMKYKEISFLTNKRLIQKSYNIFEIDFQQNPLTNLDDIEINRDLIFVNLSKIKLVSTEELDDHYEIAFKFNENDKNYIPLLLTIPNKGLPELLNILKHEISLTEKKRIGNYIVNFYKS